MNISATLVFLGVILLAAIAAKRYNFIFGFLTFFAIPTLFALVSFIDAKVSFFDIAQKTDKFFGPVLLHLYTPFLQILKKVPFDQLSDNSKIIHYLVVIGIWIISWTISSFIRRARISREKRKIEALKLGARQRF